ncbi:hypothetical protein HMPREF9120_01355 [Neisseria sp. oral taxon 020 str. F0370]|nr:hypothetical protein HMPREF9120_01355 [Neisseria sp. oral taxon 020 str. F0370]
MKLRFQTASEYAGGRLKNVRARENPFCLAQTTPFFAIIDKK